MKDALITDAGRAYIFGFTTAFFALFLGYLWSPDYLEVVTNGYNFLYMAGFGMVLFIMMWLIDGYYETKRKRKHDALVSGEEQ